MKLPADVNIPPLLVAALSARDIEVVRVTEFMDPRTPDEGVLAFASDRNAVLLTQDLDFSALLAASGDAGPSLINLRVSYVDTDRLARTIAEVVDSAQADLEAGAIITIDDGSVRVHRLPVG